MSKPGFLDALRPLDGQRFHPRTLLTESEIAAMYAGRRYDDDDAALTDLLLRRADVLDQFDIERQFPAPRPRPKLTVVH